MNGAPSRPTPLTPLPVGEGNRSHKALLPFWFVLAAIWGISPNISAAPTPPTAYAVVVSGGTKADPDWSRVSSALVQKHRASVLTFEKSVEEILPDLRQIFPRCVCFVARPEEATRQFVAQVHRLTRRLDEDPYTDCFWGILTGYDAANARRIAELAEPLTIRKAVAGTSIPLDLFPEGAWCSELKKDQLVRKQPGGKPVEEQGPDDTTKTLVGWLNDSKPDLFLTSGHATERDWQIGYSYRNGSFRCAEGKLYGLDTAGQRYPIDSPNPKIYLPVGNCLMGHVDGPNAMALAFINSAGVAQMFGYTVNTWYGYAGWGCLDYFLEQPGRFTFTEAFFANQHALIHRLSAFFPDLLEASIDENARTTAKIVVSEKAKNAGLTAQDGRGLLYDRDVLAFYGDPAWEARMAPTPSGWEQTLSREGDLWSLELKPKRGTDSFRVLDPNGSQRNGRPAIQFLPVRVGPAKLLEGAELDPVVTDDFVLVPLLEKCDPGHVYRIVFRATPL